MHSLPPTMADCFYAPSEFQAKPPEEVVYRGLTIAAMVLILVSLWAF